MTIDLAWVADLIREVLEREQVLAGTISVALVDDASIRVINARHLAHDWPTDVLSFRLSDAEEKELVGELVVSAEMAARTARETGSEPVQELALYLVHGLLHLCGYDDQTAGDAAAIRRRETEHLTVLGIDNPFDRVGSLPVMSDDSGRESACWPR